MPNIKAMVANVNVDDLEKAVPLYQELAGVESAKRFPYKNLRCASVGPFLLIEGDMSEHLTQTGTALVASMDLVLDALDRAGAEILEGPGEVPNGLRIQVRHPDGAIFEYLQPRTA